MKNNIVDVVLVLKATNSLNKLNYISMKYMNNINSSFIQFSVLFNFNIRGKAHHTHIYKYLNMLFFHNTLAGRFNFINNNPKILNAF